MFIGVMHLIHNCISAFATYAFLPQLLMLFLNDHSLVRGTTPVNSSVKKKISSLLIRCWSECIEATNPS